MSNLKYLVTIIILLLVSCKASEVEPTNYFRIGDTNYAVELSLFADYSSDNQGFNIEFYLYDTTLEKANECIDSGENCQFTGLYFDVYSDKSILQKSNYFFEEDYKGFNTVYGEIGTLINGEEDYLEIISGELQITGTTTELLELRFEATDANGQKIIGQFEGRFQDLRTQATSRPSNTFSLFHKSQTSYVRLQTD